MMILIMLLSCLGAYVAMLAALFLRQRALLFPAPLQGRSPVRSDLVRFEGGVALYRPAPTGAPTVVHLHANAEQVADLEWMDAIYAEAGVGLFAPEYPGYGHLSGQGTPTEATLFAAAERAMHHLRSLGVPNEQTVIVGQSLGTGVAIYLASRGFGARLILLSPYTSIADVVSRALPFVPTCLLRDRFDSSALAPGIKLPVLIVHGRRDNMVRFELGQRLAAQLSESILVAVDTAGHGDLWDHPQAVERITAFARDAAGDRGGGPHGAEDAATAADR